jgi:hypothetical protein
MLYTHARPDMTNSHIAQKVQGNSNMFLLSLLQGLQ